MLDVVTDSYSIEYVHYDSATSPTSPFDGDMKMLFCDFEGED